jgi:hypothetical protein
MGKDERKGRRWGIVIYSANVNQLGIVLCLFVMLSNGCEALVNALLNRPALFEAPFTVTFERYVDIDQAMTIGRQVLNHLKVAD